MKEPQNAKSSARIRKFVISPEDPHPPPSPFNKKIYIPYSVFKFMIHQSRDSSIGVATGYGLDGPGRGNVFLCSIASRLAFEPTRLPIQWVPGGLSLG
jgi:hypothetical protein